MTENYTKAYKVTVSRQGVCTKTYWHDTYEEAVASMIEWYKVRGVRQCIVSPRTLDDANLETYEKEWAA